MFDNRIVEYGDMIAFHPGHYLEEQMKELNLNQENLAQRLSISTKTVSKIINGKTPITKELADKISSMMGTSFKLWMNLQNEYDEVILNIQRQMRIDEEKEILNSIDYKYFVDNNLLEATRDPLEKIKNLCSYLHVANLKVLTEPNLFAIFRSVNNQLNLKNIISSNVWLQIVMNIANEKGDYIYDETKLKFHITEIREMTIQQPVQFYPRLVEIFDECGVAFILLPHLKNSGINGVTRWLDKNRPVIALNDRRYDGDIFWFALLHEIKHIFQKKIKKTLITTKDGKELSIEDQMYEKDADKFAMETLIPKNEYDNFVSSFKIDRDNILKFANKINIHPGIIVGRLQHESLINYNQFNDMKVKYKIKI